MKGLLLIINLGVYVLLSEYLDIRHYFPPSDGLEQLQHRKEYRERNEAVQHYEKLLAWLDANFTFHIGGAEVALETDIAERRLVDCAATLVWYARKSHQSWVTNDGKDAPVDPYLPPCREPSPDASDEQDEGGWENLVTPVELHKGFLQMFQVQGNPELRKEFVKLTKWSGAASGMGSVPEDLDFMYWRGGAIEIRRETPPV